MKHHYYKEKIKEICFEKHLTVDEIFDKVIEECPKAGRSTIYRNVEEMVTEGDLKKLCGIWAKAIFEATKNPHVHLVDKETGEIMDLDLEELGIKLPENFSLSEADIRLYWTFSK